MIARRSLVLLVMSMSALCSCSKSGTRVQPEIWAMDGPHDFATAREILTTRGPEPSLPRLPARTVVALTPGIYVSAAAGARLTITNTRIEKNGDETSPGAMTLRDAELQLVDGELCAYLATDDTGGDSQIIINLSGPMTVTARHGSLFLVRAENNEVRVTCVRGYVRIGSNRSQQAVAAGEFVSFARSDAPSTIAVVSAAGEASAQDDIETALAEESSMRELVRMHASEPASWLRR